MSTLISPDPIHYDPSKSYRDVPYRQIHHQNGCIGNFNVRLIEGKNLVRSHSSVLGIGPVKHLSLSKAHGEVSLYAEFRLGFRSREEKAKELEEDADELQEGENMTREDDASTNDCNSYSSWGGIRRTFSNVSKSAATASANASTSTSPSRVTTLLSTKKDSQTPDIFAQNSKTYRTSTVLSNANPKWPTVQSSITKSMLNIPLCKGGMPQDGMKLILAITMREEKSAVDNLVPGIVRGGGGDGGDEAFGRGSLDVTSLVLRDYDIDEGRGGNRMQIHGFTEWDIWVNIQPDSIEVDEKSNEIQQILSSDKKEGVELQKNVGDVGTVGKVRLLVSYEPFGLKPQTGDIVALENFARRPLCMAKSRPILPPLNPLKVADVKGEYLLVHFDTVQPCGNSESKGDYSNNKSKSKKPFMQIGRVRLHRNAVFVIERTNLIESAYNIALKPADIAMSTSIGKEVSHRAHPYVAVAGDLIMPAVASACLLLEVAKVSGSTAFVGLKSVTVAATQGRPQRRRRARRHSFPD